MSIEMVLLIGILTVATLSELRTRREISGIEKRTALTIEWMRTKHELKMELMRSINELRFSDDNQEVREVEEER